MPLTPLRWSTSSSPRRLSSRSRRPRSDRQIASCERCQPPLQHRQAEPDGAGPSAVRERLDAVELLPHVVRNGGVEAGLGQRVLDAVGDPYREQRLALEREQLLLHHPTHHVRHVGRVDAVAQAPLQPIAVQQRPDELEVLFFPPHSQTTRSHPQSGASSFACRSSLRDSMSSRAMTSADSRNHFPIPTASPADCRLPARQAQLRFDHGMCDNPRQPYPPQSSRPKSNTVQVPSPRGVPALTPPTTRSLVRLFLASPSDVAPERQVAEDVIATINRDFSSYTHCTVELLAWENIQPGAGRPQALINARVDLCDLFVGILWKRWGTPAGDGQTGFEEEFERATCNHRSAGSPDIWIFFKDLDVDSTDDPGQQLQQVLAFRRRLEAERQILYKNFADETDFRGKFNNHLLRHLLNRQQTPPDTTPENHAISLAPSPTEDSAAPSTDSKSILTSILHSIPSQMDSQLTEPISHDPSNAVRLSIFASALHYIAVRPQLLSSHTINIAYAFRHKISLTEFEKNHVFTSMIREGNRYTPGWFWVQGPGSSVDISERLYSLATRDHDPETRRAATRYLTRQPNVRPPERTADDVALELLADDSTDVKRVAIDYAATLGSGAVIPKLEELRLDPALSRDADSAIVSIKVRSNPPNQVRELLRSKTEPLETVVEALRVAASGLDEAHLRNAIEHAHADVRHVGATVLLERGLVSESLATELLKDNSPAVVAVGIQTLIERGNPPSTEQIRKLLSGPETGDSWPPHQKRDALIRRSLEGLSSDELDRRAGWLAVDGPAAYEVAGRREFGMRASDIRRDLTTGFAGLRERDVEALRRSTVAGVIDGLGSGADEAARAAALKAATKAVEDHLGKWTNVDDFVRGRYIAAGLRIIEECGGSEDLDLVRSHAKSDDEEVKSIVVALLKKWGDESDVQRLVAISAASLGTTPGKAGRAALAVSGDRSRLVGRFLRGDSRALTQAALDILNTDRSVGLPEDFERLLASESDIVRRGLTAVLVSRESRDDLRDLLDRYMGRGTYYYDVVADLDRALYGPAAEGADADRKKE